MKQNVSESSVVHGQYDFKTLDFSKLEPLYVVDIMF